MTNQLQEGEKIAIIGGTGNLGPGLALRWALAGFEIYLGSRSQEKAMSVAQEINEELGSALVKGMQNAKALSLANICVLTVNQSAHSSALEGLKEHLSGKILVDATARLSFPDLTPPPPPSSARTAQNILGESVRVVAAFQNVAASALRKNPRESLDSDALICADDFSAAELIMQLARAAGMRAYYVGDLDKAITVEGITSLLVAMNKHYKIHDGSLRLSGFPKQ